MKLRVGVVWWFLLFSSSGCTPYDRRSGEYNAGPVDVSHFPAAYLGAGGDAKFGGGVFAASDAFVDDNTVGYYAFPFSAAQLAADDPLALGDSFATPPAYVFDPGASDPFPGKPPRYVRAVLYIYRFAKPGNPQGLWWTRERLGLWLPPLSADNPQLVAYLKYQGWVK